MGPAAGRRSGSGFGASVEVGAGGDDSGRRATTTSGAGATVGVTGVGAAGSSGSCADSSGAAPSAADLDTAEHTCNYLLANLDAIYAPEKRPADTKEADWVKAKQDMKVFAQKTLRFLAHQPHCAIRGIVESLTQYKPGGDVGEPKVSSRENKESTGTCCHHAH